MNQVKLLQGKLNKKKKTLAIYFLNRKPLVY